jgi:hypothetical protein
VTDDVITWFEWLDDPASFSDAAWFMVVTVVLIVFVMVSERLHARDRRTAPRHWRDRGAAGRGDRTSTRETLRRSER